MGSRFISQDSTIVRSGYFTFNLAQAAATYDLATVSGGDILILECAPYNAVAAGGLTTAAIQTNDTTAVAILAATAAAALTGGISLTALTTRFVLPSGKKIQGTIVGTGNAGSIKLAVRYQPLATGALLS